MVRFTPPVTLRLQPGQVLAWQQAPARVRVVMGRVWITQRHDPHDHFLHLGDSFELRREHCAVIEAEQEVWLRFERGAAPWHERLRGALRRAGRRLTRRATPAATVAG